MTVPKEAIKLEDLFADNGDSDVIAYNDPFASSPADGGNDGFSSNIKKRQVVWPAVTA